MLNNYQRKASLGLSLWVTSMFVAPAQDLLQDLPTDSTQTDPNGQPGGLPDLPSGANTPDSGANPVVPLPPEFIPSVDDANPLIPGSDLLPSPPPIGQEIDPNAVMPSDDDVLSGDEPPEPPNFDESDENEDDPRADLPEALQNVGGISFNGGERDAETEGFSFGVRLIESYTSNLQLAGTNSEATLYTQLSPSVAWRSAPEGEARFILAASYTPTISVYHSGSEGTTLDHEVDASLTYEGEKLVIAFSGSYALTNNANRFTQTFSENIGTEFKIDSTYTLSEKTTLYGVAEYQTRKNDVSSLGNNELFTFSLSSLWDFSPRMSLGPAFRYAANSTDSFGTSKSAALAAELRYTFSEKTKISTTLGIERASPAEGGTDIAPTGSIVLDYRPSPLWTARGEVRYEAIPLTQRTAGPAGGGGNPALEDGLNGAASDGGQQLNASIGVFYRPSELWTLGAGFTHRTAPSFIQANANIVDTGFNFSVSRTLGEAQLSLRLSNNFTDFETNDGSAIEDQEFRQISLNYTHPAILEDLSLAGEISYSENTGGQTFEQTLGSITLSYSF